MKERFSIRYSVFGIQKKNPFLIISLLFTACFLPLTDVVFASDIAAKAAVVMDASTGRVLYAKNPNLKLLPASTTKLMTAMVTLDKLSLDDRVVISGNAARISPVRAHFRAGERVSIDALLHAALIKSANDAAYALAEAAAGTEENFVELMNQKAIALGLSDTRFVNSTGLPGEGQYISAHDLANMLKHALRYPAIKEIISTRLTRVTTEEGREIFLRNGNKLLWDDDSVLGGKTGYTREAKHCFVCASGQKDGTVIVALLGERRRGMLWKESEYLIGKGFEIMAGNYEPTVYFAREDYKTSLTNASYNKTVSPAKKASPKKRHRKALKAKTGKNKGAKYAYKDKTAGTNAGAAIKG